MSAISTRIQAVLAQIAHALAWAKAHGGHPAAAVQLLAVSKTFPADAVRAAFAAGQHAFGENYVQESIAKIAALADLRSQLSWHFVGPLQSNKTRLVAEQFDWVHSVDRLKIAQRLSEQRPADLPPLQVCLQINISGEATKSGVLPSEAPAVAYAISQLPRLQLRGLMAIPEPSHAEPQSATARAPFAALRKLRDTCQQALAAQGSTVVLDTLSMGMSADLAAAICEGATLVRVGTAIFGQRHDSPT